MKIVVTGAAGFLGSRLADALLRSDSPLPVDELVLIDLILPTLRIDSRVRVVVTDLTSPTAVKRLVSPDCNVFFHLAAIDSSQVETDSNHDVNVIFDVTRALLEQARKVAPSIKFIFTSTVAAYGGNLSKVVTDMTATQPQTSCELLINDYARKRYVDGRFLGLPTITVQAGDANKARTSFVSGIVRQQLNREEDVCPVSGDKKIWISSLRTAVRNIIHAATVPASSLGNWRGINLPGFVVSENDILDAMKKVAVENVTRLVNFKSDARISRMVSSVPILFDNNDALSLGFEVDQNFPDVILSYIDDDFKNCI